MFRDRDDAGTQLARLIKGRPLRDPIVLAIPRGGVVTGAALARELGSELDVILSRKLRAPMQPELAVGAISEDGHVYLNRHVHGLPGLTDDYLARERDHQHFEIARRKKLFRGVRPRASLVGRSVIVTDDGIATGATMIAALDTINIQNPSEVIVAVPVASPATLVTIRRRCDETVCLLTPEDFWAIGQYYSDFAQVTDEEVVLILHQFVPSRCANLPEEAEGMSSPAIDNRLD